jgi:hypothetical protein
VDSAFTLIGCQESQENDRILISDLVCQKLSNSLKKVELHDVLDNKMLTKNVEIPTKK